VGCGIYGLSNVLSAFMPVGELVATCVDRKNLAGLNICRGIAGIGAAIMHPAAAGVIGSMYPSGRPRSMAFAAITCGELINQKSTRALR
jgi:MFS family permease